MFLLVLIAVAIHICTSVTYSDLASLDSADTINSGGSFLSSPGATKGEEIITVSISLEYDGLTKVLPLELGSSITVGELKKRVEKLVLPYVTMKQHLVWRDWDITVFGVKRMDLSDLRADVESFGVRQGSVIAIRKKRQLGMERLPGLNAHSPGLGRK